MPFGTIVGLGNALLVCRSLRPTGFIGMKSFAIRLACLLAWAAAAIPAGAAPLDPPVHKKPLAANAIKIGGSGPLTGGNASSYRELVDGANLYFDEVNRTGGVRGRPIEFLISDDLFDVKKTVENVNALITKDKVLALLLVRGTPHNEALLPIIETHRVPLLAPSTGATSLHLPVKKYVFNVRTPYRSEARKLVELLVMMGSRNIAVIYVDDSFGKDVLAGLEEGFAKSAITPLVRASFDRAKASDNDSFMDPIVKEIEKANPQAIVFAGAGLAVARGVKKLRAAGIVAHIATTSNNASGGFIKLLNEHSNGILVAQVYPDERVATIPLVQEAQRLASQAKLKLSPASIEGFAAAKVMVAALREAGDNPSRESLQAALEEKMKSFDLGGVTLGYSKNDHTGIEYTDLSIIKRDHFRR